jgi:hypothetical protein
MAKYLRATTAAGFINKGSELTWAEADNNLVEIVGSINQISEATQVPLWVNSQTYFQGDIVTYDSKLWQWVPEVSGSGVIPSTDPTKWNEVYSGSLLHNRNKDTYLDFGGENQVSAAEIKSALINAALPYQYASGFVSFTEGGGLEITTVSSSFNFDVASISTVEGGFRITITEGMPTGTVWAQSFSFFTDAGLTVLEIKKYGDTQVDFMITSAGGINEFTNKAFEIRIY